MIRGITYGTFDLTHVGHVRLLKRIKEQCDHLTVVVSTDKFNELKGKKCIISDIHRAEMIQAIKYVDNVIFEHSWYQKEEDIKEHNIDKFFMGSDWTGKFDNLPCEVIYLERTPDISTTIIKEELEKK